MTEEGYANTYSYRFFKKGIKTEKIPKNPMPANVVYQLIHDELDMDGKPSLNLASFVNTWMEDEAIQLINENLHKNFIDHDEYPQTEIIHQKCVHMLLDLCNYPNGIGTATVGSSEAIMLALLAHKFRWKKNREKENKPTDKPNIVFGAEVHVCWEKFAKYFDVEMRMIPMEKDYFMAPVKEIEKRIDENTICIGAILGSTYAGQISEIEQINTMLLKIKKEKGFDIPIHVDAASGGFILPFTKPEMKWDFRLEQVKSINLSGHKYGLVYPGLGWLLLKEEFPEGLTFKVNYLGGWMPTYTLNFSKGSAMVIAQYYNFLRLGKEGYTKIMNNCIENAKYLSSLLEKSNKFIIINSGKIIPVVAVRLKEEKNYSVFDLCEKVREYGWIISAYTLPKNAENIAILRIVVREHLSHDMINILYNNIMETIEKLEGIFERKKELTRQHPIC